jgi:hypothetical protein
MLTKKKATSYHRQALSLATASADKGLSDTIDGRLRLSIKKALSRIPKMYFLNPTQRFESRNRRPSGLPSRDKFCQIDP